MSGCGNFSKANKDLGRIVTKLSLRPSDNATIFSLLCNYAFEDSTAFGHISNPINNETICFAFSSKFCNMIALLETPLSCLTIPKCAALSKGRKNFTEAICPSPLMRTRTKAAIMNGVYCSPPCYQETRENGITTVHIALCISLAVHWISVAITFVTWAKMKKP